GRGGEGALPAALAAGAVLAMAAAVLARREPPRVRPAGALLLAAVPGTLALLHGAIPAPGAVGGGGPWFGWHLALMLPAAGALLLGAELLRPSGRVHGARWPMVAVLLAGLALWLAAAGWRPGVTVPPPALAAWLLAVVALPLPATRFARVVAAAVTAGAGAGVLTWASLQEARLALAESDLAGLGVGSGARPAPDLGAALLAMAEPPEPATATELFVRWEAVALSDSGHPAELALFEPDGSLRASLALDSLDLPPGL